MVLGSPGAEPSARSSALVGMAVAALRAGNVVQARQMLNDRLAQDPTDANALAILADIASGQQSIEEATILLQRAVAADPSPQRRLALIDHLRQHGAPALALDQLEQLPQDVREEFEVRIMEAAVVAALGLHERQIKIYRAVLRNCPSATGVWVSLGNALNTVGRSAEAAKSLARAVRSEPTCGQAYWALANLKSFRFSNRELVQMRSVLRQKLSDQDSLNIHFALGKAYEDRGDYEESFHHYSQANAIRWKEFGSDRIAVSALVDESIAAFTPEFFARNADSGCPEEGPIFVLGLHRS